MTNAYGIRARSWAESLARSPDAPSLPAIVADVDQCVEAYAQAVRYRSRNEAFAVAIGCDDELTRFAKSYGEQLLGAETDVDRQITLADALAGGTLALNGVSAAQLGMPSNEEMLFALGLFTSGGLVYVRSRAEHERLSMICKDSPWETATIEIFDSRVPTGIARSAGADSIVVWAPDLTLAEVRVLRFALRSFRRPVEIVCRGGQTGPGAGTIRAVEEAGDILARAAVVIDAGTTEPSSAFALARLGIPVVACASSGAHERLSGLRVYDYWNVHSIFSAVAEAIGTAAPRIRAESYPVRVPAVAAIVPDATPLVSVLVLTHDRREWLPRALDSIARQTYANLEIVVVNNGGVPVDDIVATHPNARLIEREHNDPRALGFNDALRAARGRYVTILEDDDLYFPDHIASLVAAAERSGLPVVHSTTVNALIEGPADDGHRIAVFFPGCYQALDRDVASVFSPFAGSVNLLVRRDVYDEVGEFDPECSPADDYEMLLRIAGRFEFVHVDRMTAMYSMRLNDANFSTIHAKDFWKLHETIYRKNPLTDRRDIAASRANHIEYLRANGLAYITPLARLDEEVRVETLLP